MASVYNYLPLNKSYIKYGEDIGRLYTDFGLPIDIAFDNLNGALTQQDKVSILTGALSWLVEHKRLSGASDKAIERQRDYNRRIVDNFIKTNEVGLY